MSQRKFLYGSDYLSQTPKDIQELIIYETKPHDLDTLCRINEEMSILCQNNRILENYLHQHNLSIPPLSRGKTFEVYGTDGFFSYLINISIKSLTLLRYVLSKIQNLYGKTRVADYIRGLILYLLTTESFPDEYIIQILSSLNLTPR